MKKRKESFWGLHFDFHAKPTDVSIGKALKEEEIREICRELKPDFIQIDCKGHPGYTSYPTSLGNAVPDMEKDTLALWRRVTKEEGVSLYMHYSGVYDVKYCDEHPNERALMADGRYHNGSTRLIGTYCDELLIPQLLELAEKYEVNGVWIDGDCWMALTDFSSETIVAFEKETEIDLEGKLPKNPNDKYYYEYKEFNRELFRRYLRRYVDAVHEKHPDFEICSNWAFSDHMPEKVRADVDFLSGDLNPMNSFNSARYAARALAQQNGYAWDLMSWNFRNIVGGKQGYCAKHPNQLKQEAASVISVGGAFQDYIPQNRDGSPRMWEIRNLKDVSKFVLERKDFCHRGKVVPQAALLLSTYDRARESEHLFSRTGYEKTMGMTALLCDVGQSLEIVCEHTLFEKINEYKMIVVPELYCGLEEKTIEALLGYAKNGGNLVLVGKNTCSIFSSAGAPYLCKEFSEFVANESKGTEDGHNNASTNKLKPYWFTIDGRCFGNLFSPCEIYAKNGKYNAYFCENPTEKAQPLSATVPFGEGTVTAIGFDIGSEYLNGTQFLQRDLMREIANSLYVPIVKVEKANGRLEVVSLEKDGRLMIQLVNAGGTHTDASVASDDYIPPILDITLSLSLKNEPEALILQPQGRELMFTKEADGSFRVDIDRVDIHSVVEVC